MTSFDSAQPGDDREPSRPAGDSCWRLRSEFATARVSLDHGANGPRLRVTDVSSGTEIYLDPFELVSLARSRHERLQSLVMPEEYLTESDEWALELH